MSQESLYVFEVKPSGGKDKEIRVDVNINGHPMPLLLTLPQQYPLLVRILTISTSETWRCKNHRLTLMVTLAMI